jgi:hypothetical protein
MKALFHQDDVDCEGMWYAIESFVTRKSCEDDEPAIFSRLAILETFMEGLLFWGLENVMSLDKCSLPSWKQCLANVDDLRILLEQKSGSDAWLTSLAHCRLQLLKIDKDVYGQSTKRARYDYIGNSINILSQVQAQSENAGNNRTLEGALWRLRVLRAGEDPESISCPNVEIAVPFGLYSRYHALARLTFEASKYPDSLSSPSTSQHDEYTSHGSSSSVAPRLHQSFYTSGKSPFVSSARAWLTRSDSSSIAQNPRSFSTSSSAQLSTDYFVRNAEFFCVGRVFSVHDGGPASPNSKDERLFSTLQERSALLRTVGGSPPPRTLRYVVVRESHNYCSALPITTYAGKGIAKVGVVKSDHVIIYTSFNPLKLEQDELPAYRETRIRLSSIQVKLLSATNRLNAISRVNFSDVHKI